MLLTRLYPRATINIAGIKTLIRIDINAIKIDFNSILANEDDVYSILIIIRIYRSITLSTMQTSVREGVWMST